MIGFILKNQDLLVKSYDLSFWAKTDKNHSMNILSQSCTSEEQSQMGDHKTDLDLKFTTGQLNQEGLSFKNSMHFATAPF